MRQYLIRTLEFSTREFAHTRFRNFRVIIIIITLLNLLQKTRSLHIGISLCADFSTKRLYRRWRCDQSPSDRFSLVPRCCSRSRSSSRCTLNDAICCQLSMRGRLGVTRGARARRLCVRPLALSFSQRFVEVLVLAPSSVLADQTIANLVSTLHEGETGVLIYN